MMPKAIRDTYLYFIGMNGTKEDLFRIHKTFSNPDLWYKGHIIEAKDVVRLLQSLNEK